MSHSQRPLCDMRDSIRSFSLDNLPHGSRGYQLVLLQLVGDIGPGKSALINSCKCVLEDGEFHMYARATSASHGAETMIRTSYELTPTVSIVDNRPLANIDSRWETAEMYAQLGNFRPLNEPVNKQWTFSDFMSTLEDKELEPNYTDLTVPVLVYTATFGFLNDERKSIQTFLEHCRLMTGLMEQHKVSASPCFYLLPLCLSGFIPIVVITHKTEMAASGAENTFRAMGIEQVILVENYTTEDHERSRRRDTDILTFLYNALQDVAYHMARQQDPRRERVTRKKFLLNYIHDVDVQRRFVRH